MDVQQQLDEANRQLKQAEHIAKIGHWCNDLVTGITTWSEEARRIYGLQSDDLCTSFEASVALIHPDDRAGVLEEVQAASAGQQELKLTHRVICGDNEEREVFVLITFQYDDQGIAVAMNGITYDITEIIKVKQRLTRTEENMGLIMDLIPLSIYARDADGNYLWGNRVFLKHYGLTAEALNGKNIRDLVVSEQELKELTQQDAKVLASDEKLFVSEFCQDNSQGQPTAWRIIKVPFTPEGSNRKAILGIAEDITIRKKYENDLIKLATTLSDRNKELEQFSQMVSHDLRGPLSTLLGVTDLIGNVQMNQEEVATILTGTKESLHRLDSIVRTLNQILDPRKQVARQQ